MAEAGSGSGRKPTNAELEARVAELEAAKAELETDNAELTVRLDEAEAEATAS